MKLRALSILISVFAVLSLSAQMAEPIKWDASVSMDDATKGQVTLAARIEPGWHLYAFNLPDGGPNPTRIAFQSTPGIKFTGDLKPSMAPVKAVDMIFHLELRWWEREVVFTRPFEVVESGNNNIDIEVSFQACNNSSCIAPSRLNFSLPVKIPAASPASASDHQSESHSPAEVDHHTDSSTVNPARSTPVDKHDTPEPISRSPLWFIFIWCLGIVIFILLSPHFRALIHMQNKGAWLNTTRVVLGFLLLALSVKILSIADLAYGWGLLDREVFLSLWIVIFALLGLYLLGKIKFANDGDSTRLSVGRFMLAIASLTFALYLLPGLWGAPLNGVKDFVPPVDTQDFNLHITTPCNTPVKIK